MYRESFEGGQHQRLVRPTVIATPFNVYTGSSAGRSGAGVSPLLLLRRGCALRGHSGTRTREPPYSNWGIAGQLEVPGAGIRPLSAKPDKHDN